MKTKSMEQELRNMFKTEYERRDNGRCPFCDKLIDMNSFKDELSIKEFQISGLCQECQNQTFNQ